MNRRAFLSSLSALSAGMLASKPEPRRPEASPPQLLTLYGTNQRHEYPYANLVDYRYSVRYVQAAPDPRIVNGHVQIACHVTEID
jgi:hypothetical protein